MLITTYLCTTRLIRPTSLYMDRPTIRTSNPSTPLPDPPNQSARLLPLRTSSAWKLLQHSRSSRGTRPCSPSAKPSPTSSRPTPSTQPAASKRSTRTPRLTSNPPPFFFPSLHLTSLCECRMNANMEFDFYLGEQPKKYLKPHKTPKDDYPRSPLITLRTTKHKMLSPHIRHCANYEIMYAKIYW